jgi:prepilin-type processing-associated H-X9-DG protein
MTGILMYSQDNDDVMPLAWKIKGQLGNRITQPGELAAGKTPIGMPIALYPYTKNYQIFKCPNDPKFYGNKAANKVVGVTALSIGTSDIGKYTYFDALGMSYKFNKDGFTMPPEVASSSANQNGIDKSLSDDHGDMQVHAAGTSDPYVNPPTLMKESFYAKPAETRLIRDINAPWEEFQGVPNGFEEKDPREVATHRQGINVAFADGHVKFITSYATYKSYCDGPTWSPNGDGSCNTGGVERKTQ